MGGMNRVSSVSERNTDRRPGGVNTRAGVVRALLSAILLVTSLMVGGSFPGSAHAAPGDTPDPSETTLAWPTLGLEPSVVLGPYTTLGVNMPVPAGMNAQRLRGIVRSPVNIDSASIDVTDGDGTLLATMVMPPGASAVGVVPFDVDISAASVRASTIDLSFVLRPSGGGDRICGPRQELTISDLATVFTGLEPPVTTVATFFAPVLEQVAIYVPNDADATEQQTVLALVSTLVRIYSPETLQVTVINHPRGASPPPTPPRSRAIVVEGGDTTGVSVEGAGGPGVYLKFAGKGDELVRQVSLLDNQLQSLAQAPAFRVDQAGSDYIPGGDVLTFGQLKLNGRADVLRTGRLGVGLDRSMLGPGRVDSVQVHLLANYTPVPDDDNGSLVVRSNGNIVYRALLDSSGHLDGTFDLQRQMFDQRINLDFALTFTPRQVCGPLIAPITFQIDPRSEVTVRRGGPPLGGFASVPSEFSPDFLVAFDGSDPNQLSYAAQAVSSIARLTRSPLTPKVVDLKTAVDTNSGALIVANAASVKKTSLDPPIGGEGAALDVRLPAVLRGSTEGGLGSIQAFSDRAHNRSVVLITTTADWSLVPPLLGYLDGLSGGWLQLTGDVLAVGPGGTPTELAIRSETRLSGTPAEMPDASSGGSHRRLVQIAGGAGIVVLVAIAAALIWRRRRGGGPDQTEAK